MVFRLLRNLRRNRLLERPFPTEWMPIINQRFPFYAELDEALKEKFRDELKLFVWERKFFGAGGMEVTEEMKVIIGGAAVRLILRLDRSYYDKLGDIVLYPYDFKLPDDDDDGRRILGQAHRFGTVILSWPAVLAGVSRPADGHDTTMHEFAHILDLTEGGFDGTPVLDDEEDYEEWARVMTRDFFKLKEGDSRIGRVLRDYGATYEAEFFAVATEAFFERPRELEKRAPDLFALMAKVYGFEAMD